MKELERERGALLQGLAMADRMRDWYLQQIHAVRLRQIQAKQGFRDTVLTVESRPNRACLLLTKIQEVNSCLSDLISTPGKAPYLHRPAGQSVATLQEQHRRLTKELSGKSERITALERERTELVNRIIAAQSLGYRGPGGDGPTFIQPRGGARPQCSQ